jgi:flavin reductase (DIM6/NTAB) family NADH-FMN oxidoreductase RutF
MLTANLYRQVMRRYATGVMVLTVRALPEDADDFHAVTVNSVTSVSLEPILLLVCLEKNARSHVLLQKAGTFALNILSGEQTELGKQFAYDRGARNTPRAQARHCISERGELRFSDSLGYLECRVVAEYPGGDHTIFLGEVLKAELDGARSTALGYYEGDWTKIEPP